MKLYELLASAGIKYRGNIPDAEIDGITSDSSRVGKNFLFVCIKGQKNDGHGFCADAAARGAVCAVVERGAEFRRIEGLIYIEVNDTRRALSNLFAAWYRHPERSMRVIGVTGTNGKTSVSHMLYAILTAAGHECGLIGTAGCFSCRYGIPDDPAFDIDGMTTPEPEELYRMMRRIADDGAEFLVMEVTSHAIRQGRVAPIKFECGIFTNLSPEHLDLHGNMENYYKVKSKLFDQCKFGIINTQDAYGRRLFDSPDPPCRMVSCSESLGADHTARDIICDSRGVGYRLMSRRCIMNIRCQTPGKFNVMNSLQAAACAMELGIDGATVRDALGNFSGVRGRMERVALPDADFSVIIDFAHTPDAMENLLNTVRNFRKSNERIVILFGCGGDRDKSKRRVMGSIASRLADFLIITSDNSRGEDPEDIIYEIMNGVDREKEYTVIPDRRQAIKYAVNSARSGDIIILAGKGHENYEINSTGKHPFCERDIVIEAFEKRKDSIQ